MPLDLRLARGEHRQQAVAARFTSRLSLLALRGIGEPLADPLRKPHQEAVAEGSRTGPARAIDLGAGERHGMCGLHEQRGEQGVDGREVGLETARTVQKPRDLWETVRHRLASATATNRLTFADS